MVDDVPVLLYRMGDQVTAMAERCAHETGPLSEGEVIGTGADACVVCPWHGSTFRLRDGTGHSWAGRATTSRCYAAGSVMESSRSPSSKLPRWPRLSATFGGRFGGGVSTG